MIGSWTVTVTPTPGPGAPPLFRQLFTFTENGGLVESDALASPPGLPGTWTSGHGSWIQRGHDYTLTFVKFLFDKKGQFVGEGIVHEAGTLNQAFDTYSGAGKAEIFDSRGTLLASFVASTQGTRIRVEPAR